VQEQAMKLQRMGLDDLRKDQAQEEKREEAKKEALETLRPQVFLMALAQKENITVNDQEVEMAIYGMAMRAQQDYKKVSEAYHKSGLIYELRDRILADKALEMVYSKAKINEVPAVSLSEPKNAD
jgi:trigger factor